MAKFVIHPGTSPGSRELVRWVREQGVVPENVVHRGMYWETFSDGLVMWNYFEFLLTEKGHRILMPAAQHLPEVGIFNWSTEPLTHAKRFRSVRVPGLPPFAVPRESVQV